MPAGAGVTCNRTTILPRSIPHGVSGGNIKSFENRNRAASATEQLAGNVGMSKEVVDSAAAVRDRHEEELMSIPGAVGTAIGMSDQPGKPAIEVYVKKMTPQAQAAAPKEVEGVPVKLIENGGSVAY
jgi:hypothetical protein